MSTNEIMLRQKCKEILDSLDSIKNQCIDSLEYKSKISLIDEMAGKYYKLILTKISLIIKRFIIKKSKM